MKGVLPNLRMGARVTEVCSLMLNGTLQQCWAARTHVTEARAGFVLHCPALKHLVMEKHQP